MFIAQQVPVISIFSCVRDRLPSLRYSESRQQHDIMERSNLPHMSPPTDAMECEEVSSPRIVLILRD
jgi:hypothetical protein